MFGNIKEKFNNIFNSLKGKKIITEDALNNAMREMRVALLDADVPLKIVKEVIENIKQEAIGQEVIKSVSPAQMIIKIVYDEIVKILSTSAEDKELKLNQSSPSVILMAGLQGSGKTTLSGKLALYLKEQSQNNKKILLVSLDSYRPAAKEQLEILANKINVDSLEIIKNEMPIDTATRAKQFAKKEKYDIIIYDSAGRMQIDENLIDELAKIKEIISPQETILVIDSLIGQESINIANIFNEKIGIDSCALSRIDGDGRGGAALSVKHATNIPIKLLSVGEKLEDLEKFDPERIASRIIGQGDVVSLVEKASKIIDKKEIEKTTKKIQKGQFDLDDYIAQIKNMKKMGGFSKILDFIPGNLSSKITGKMDDKSFMIQEAIINSMTPKERRKPELLNISRKNRIAKGSGMQMQEVNKLLKQFKKIQSMMKKMGKLDQESLMNNMKNLF